MNFVWIVLVFSSSVAKPGLFGPFGSVMEGEQYLANNGGPSGPREFIRIGYDLAGNIGVMLQNVGSQGENTSG